MPSEAHIAQPHERGDGTAAEGQQREIGACGLLLLATASRGSNDP